MNAGRTLVELAGVTFGYDREPVIEGVDLVVREGDFLAILGPNGGGKTTLLRLVLGLEEPWRGTIRRHTSGRRGSLGYVPQSPVFDRSFPLRVREVVLMGRLGLRAPLRPYGRADRLAADEAIARFGLGEVAGSPVGEISGGQLQRTLIARAMVGEPEVLFLDEPLASLDPEFRRSLLAILREVQETIPVVVVTHDLTPFSGLVAQVACVNRRLFYHPHGEVTGDMLEEVYGCPVELVSHGVPHRVLREHDGSGHTHEGHDHPPGAGPGDRGGVSR